MSAVVDEVLNDSGNEVGSLEAGITQQAESACDSRIGSIVECQEPAVGPAICLAHASFSWTLRDDIRDEAGPSIPPLGSTSVYGPVQTVMLPIHDIIYRPIGRSPFYAEQVLSDISISISSGSLTVIVGIVGSGMPFQTSTHSLVLCAHCGF
jgi:ABC-type multidrug transport system fused ATPase/permease subunit